MPEGEAERRRREFASRAPELRAAAVVELLRLTELASLTPDEVVVLGHLAARAGYAFDGFHIPEFAALWGGAGDSYFPPVPLPVERARDAAHFLRRRGVLRPEGGGVFVVIEALLPAAPPPAAPEIPVLAKAKTPKRSAPKKKAAKKKAPKKRAK